MPPPTNLDTTQKGTEVGSVFVSNYPPFSTWSEDDNDAYRQALATPHDPTGPDVPLGLYMHIPFCRKRCKFCYFRVYTDRNASQIKRYLEALAREVETLAAQPAIAGRRLDYIYFGGGTPSYIAVKHLKVLVERVRGVMPWDGAQEITFECEPGTLTESKVNAIREIGVTRLSLGVENFDDTILEDNGRAHLTGEIDRCMPWIRAADFAQLNVDLIAGMVGETWDTWRDTVAKTIELGPDSVTIYQMELPFNTIYSKGILGGDESPVADWTLKREWNDYAIEELRAAGFDVSSAYTMIKPGKTTAQFRYRDALWHGADLLGTGIASFGHLAGIHAQNLSGWEPYLSTVESGELPLKRSFKLSDTERLTRELILQLKLGYLDFGYFIDKFGVDPAERYADAFERHRADDMLERHDGGVSLTRQGLLQVDRLLPAFYDEHYRNIRYT
ncbi:MAG: coproporphyrinogen-III oxidase family protein [Acidobacteriota bacterium]